MSDQANNNQDIEFSSETHSFDTAIAAKYGVTEAIMIKHFTHWITLNRRMEKNFIDGKTWTYQTLEYIAAHFAYLSWDQVNRLIRKLCSVGVLKKGNFNKHKYDRTVWYAFAEEGRFLGNTQPTKPNDLANSPDGDGGIATPIPDPKTDTEEKENSLTRVKEKTGGTPPLVPDGTHPPPIFIFPDQYQGKIRITQSEYDELVDRFHAGPMDTAIESMHDWSKTNPKEFNKRKDHVSLARNWVKRDLKFKKPETYQDFSTNEEYAKRLLEMFGKYIVTGSFLSLETHQVTVKIGSTSIKKTIQFKEGSKYFKKQLDNYMGKLSNEYSKSKQ